MNRTTASGMLAAVLAATVLAGCGTTAPASTAQGSASSAEASPRSTAHNEADVAFVQGMIPHHTQAVDMTRLVAGHTSNQKIVDLAAQIARAQGPEITQMQGFLQSWGTPAAPTATSGGMSGMSGMGTGTAMPGMMSDQQMQQLGAANGTGFDRMFLQMMIEHHTGAVTMAQSELRDGQSADTKALAQKIIDAQQAEIATMKRLQAGS
ncbi:DUF305 domain-containing protein [Pseudonocardia sp. 73-21]|uniref:DUF305 domain-containing protein n=1 Tax=Pseudonocardia sp. 73-21 TaxID=1895809 RepID=UPI00095B7D11|nr:DUF305 domain-containing protein [Pseudonocardia sp. 73-21]OJY53359.1 MAG: hypothetical protein BGP03_03970 [Pseudonocardia sp. 73-21]